MTGIRISVALLAILFVPNATSAQEHAVQNGALRTRLVPAYDAANEVSLQGTIEKIMAKRDAGSPLGLHVIIATASADVDAHLGLLNAKRASEAGITPGACIRALGAMAQVGAMKILLVRELTARGQTIVIRNKRGFPAFQMAPRASSAKVISRGGPR